MANAYLNAYMNNPTAGGTDGTIISTGDNSAPLTFILDASENEVSSQTVALRCETGYQTITDITISIVSDTSNHWALSLNGTNWSNSVTITDTVVNSNVTFIAKASATDTEELGNDSSVKINVRTKIAAV